MFRILSEVKLSPATYNNKFPKERGDGAPQGASRDCKSAAWGHSIPLLWPKINRSVYHE